MKRFCAIASTVFLLGCPGRTNCPPPRSARALGQPSQRPAVTGLNGTGAAGAVVGGAVSGILAVANAAEEGRCREPTSMVRQRFSDGRPLPPEGHAFDAGESGRYRCTTVSALEDTITAESALSARDTCGAMTGEPCTCSPE